MRSLVLSLFALAAFLSVTPPSNASWGNGGCTAPARFAPIAQAAPVVAFSGWDNAEGGWRYQYESGRVIAGYHSESGEYRVRFGGEWSAPTSPPWEASETDRRQRKCKCSDTCSCGKHCKCKANGKACSKDCTCAPKQQEEVGQVFFGVDAEKLSGNESYRINGKKCHRQDVIDALTGDGQLTDDSGKLRLTVIGQDADRKQVLTDLASNPTLAPFKDRYLIQDYAPDSWAIARCGFHADGSPVIYIQDPTGKVLHRQDSYLGADKLAEALRRADPSYDPSKDPNVLNPKPAPAPSGLSWWDEIPAELKYIGAALLGFFGLPYVGRKK